MFYFASVREQSVEQKNVCASGECRGLK